MDKEKGKKDLCCFCGIGDDQELELGKMYALEKISVHYYCLVSREGKVAPAVLKILIDALS